jgi:hypothetical protein
MALFKATEAESMKRNLRSMVVAALAAGLALCAGVAHAQTTALPPRSHSGPTAMSIKAETLQHQVTGEILAAKDKGQDVSAADRHKSEGDAALKAGHLRIAVEDYEAAQKSLGAPAK